MELTTLTPVTKAERQTFWLIGQGPGPAFAGGLASLDDIDLKISAALGLSGYATFERWDDGGDDDLVDAVGVPGNHAIILNDPGTHTDPVVGGTVQNTGIYKWSTSPAGWKRIADTQALAAQEVLNDPGFVLVADDLALGAGSSIAKVAANETNINTVAARDAAIATVAARDAAIGTVAARDADIGTVAARDSDIGVVADDLNLGPSSLLAAAPDAISAVATVGTNVGNQNVRGAFSGFAPAVHTRRSVLRYDVHAKALVAPGLMTDMQKASARVIDFIGHSDPAGSGVQSAGAGRKPSSGIAGSDPRHMEYLLQQGFDPAYRVINRCVSARASPAMAALVGAVPILVTLASGTTLAASGATALSLVTPGTHGPSQARGNSYDVYEGYIGTQRCRLINTGTGAGTGAVPIYTLEQVGGVAPITVAPLTQFVLAPDPLDWAQQILFATRNDPTLAQSYFNVDAMMTGRRPGAPLPFLYGTWNWADGTEDTGSAGLTRVLTENARMQDKYGRRFFDWRACFRGDAPYDGSYFPSIWQFSGIDKNQPQNDYAAPGDWITNGRLPKFWMNAGKGGSDYNHTNEDTKYWRSRYWIEFFGKPLGALGYAV